MKISDIKDYNTLYKAYSKLSTKGDNTSSAKNASKIYKRFIDIDGDKTAELWEFMELANKYNKTIIFHETDHVKSLQDIKLQNISPENPILLLLGIESEVIGKDKAVETLRTIDQKIGLVNSKLRSYGKDINDKVKLLAIRMVFKNKHSEYNAFLTEGLTKKKNELSSETYSYLYMAAAYENKWPIEYLHESDKIYLRWNNKQGSFLYNIVDSEFINVPMQKPVLKNKNLPYALAYYNKGKRFNSQKKYDKALECFMLANKIYPNSTKFLFNLGLLYKSTGKYDKAIDIFTKIIELDPLMESSYYSRSECYKKLKEVKKAKVDNEKFMELMFDKYK